MLDLLQKHCDATNPINFALHASMPPLLLRVGDSSGTSRRSCKPEGFLDGRSCWERSQSAWFQICFRQARCRISYEAVKTKMKQPTTKYSTRIVRKYYMIKHERRLLYQFFPQLHCSAEAYSWWRSLALVARWALRLDPGVLSATRKKSWVLNGIEVKSNSIDALGVEAPQYHSSSTPHDRI